MEWLKSHFVVSLMLSTFFTFLQDLIHYHLNLRGTPSNLKLDSKCRFKKEGGQGSCSGGPMETIVGLVCHLLSMARALES